MAYNEEDIIARRIGNCLNLNYPKDRLEIIVCSDASTDRTVEIVKEYKHQGVGLVQASEQNKTRTREMGIEKTAGEILFFTDADTLYQPNCIRKMVRHYTDPKVGCVGGELRSFSLHKNALREGQGFYWRWEYALRRRQNQSGVLTKVSGANMSMRKELYQSLPATIDIDQAAGPMVILQGYRVVHEPEAIAYEEFPASLSGELSTRRRLTIRSLTALWHYRELLNFFKRPWIALNLTSYRLFRYLIPFILAGIFISNIFLVNKSRFYDIAFTLQAFFYLLALTGYFFEKIEKRFWLFSWPFAFLWFNLGIFLGDIEFLLGKRIRAYEKVN
jgi:cellulose synthase/poly-beta-1,6-N-acetylglucosamine synthase-like glycosyltransferase